jgi:hypothetical protein
VGFWFLNIGFAEMVSCKLGLFGYSLLLTSAGCAFLLLSAMLY